MNKNYIDYLLQGVILAALLFVGVELHRINETLGGLHSIGVHNGGFVDFKVAVEEPLRRSR
jgi:hypothetical protein